MKPSKSIPLAVTVVIIAVASILAPIAITESWFSDEESADITISVPLLKIEANVDDNTTVSYWDGTGTYELQSDSYILSPIKTGATVKIYIDNPSNCNISGSLIESPYDITGSVTLNVTGIVKISLSQEALNQVSQ